MKFLEKTRQRLASYYMDKAMNKVSRQRQISNFSKIKSIGLLFDLDTPSEYEIIKEYISFLKNENKELKVIGFFNSNKLPDFSYSKIDFITINKKNTNWLFKPEQKILQDFVHSDFDLIINLSLKDIFTLKYFVALSKAKCKLGNFKKGNEKFYDMMISLDENKDLKFFIDQINIYLKMINQKVA